jgi:hypothetical protein
MRIVAAGLLVLAATVAGCDPAAPTAHRSLHAPADTAPASTPHASTLPGPASGSPPSPSGGHQSCRSKPDLGAGAARDVLFRAARVGWVLTDRRLLATADGGRRWTTSYRASGRQKLSSVDFVDARHGWIVASDGLLRTTDAGRHWRLLSATCPRTQLVAFATRRLGYAIASRERTRYGATTGGVLFRTADGGVHWHRVSAPPEVQSICLAGRHHAWLGADGNLYRASGSMSRWQLIVRHRDYGSARFPPVANVECRSARAAWAVIFCQCGAMSQSPHIGYHLTRREGTPLFAEQYFPHPHVHVRRQSPSAYSGPFAVINSNDAVFFDVCPACPRAIPGSHGRRVLDTTEYAGIARNDGRQLIRTGPMAGISAASAASFPTRDQGWVLGTRSLSIKYHEYPRPTTLLMHTTDGGRTWRVGLRL